MASSKTPSKSSAATTNGVKKSRSKSPAVHAGKRKKTGKGVGKVVKDTQMVSEGARTRDVRVENMKGYEAIHSLYFTNF